MAAAVSRRLCDVQRTTRYGRSGAKASATAVQIGTTQRHGTSASGDSMTMALGG